MVGRSPSRILPARADTTTTSATLSRKRGLVAPVVFHGGRARRDVRARASSRGYLMTIELDPVSPVGSEKGDPERLARPLGNTLKAEIVAGLFPPFAM